MMLSIIIVNYNVKYFLEQCLCSVRKALATAELIWVGSPPGSSNDRPAATELNSAEVFVVDNNSTDASAQWLLPRFPLVQFILNTENRGFGAANNQALALARGRYILFLNPDTILPEDVFSTCLAFMESFHRAGAAGVRMIDGSGRFLKESKRGFPTPWTAFCKLSGLTALFPRSALFAGYYLGHLSQHENQPAPILSGAFMVVRKEALKKASHVDPMTDRDAGANAVMGFDERFFLYAEDIDLSYRLELAGYTNYYIADTTILHFKGESTKRDLRYVRLFYKAMSQFREKYAGHGDSRLMKGLIGTGIALRGVIEALRHFFLKTSPGGAVPPNPSGPTELILYEGEENSFKDIIQTLEKTAASKGKKRVYKIHAAGSGAAVGSPDKKQRGEVTVMQ